MKYPVKESDFDPPWSEVEAAFVKAACAGEEYVVPGFEEGTVPAAKTAENTIRASVIRYVAMGGCAAHAVHPKGVDLDGAFVDGPLDLELCKDLRRIILGWCALPGGIVARDAGLEGLFLLGCHLENGLNLERARVTGNVALRSGFRAKGAVSLSGAQIGGQLDCENGTFENTNGNAVMAEDAVIKGAFFWRKGAKVTSGRMSLMGAQVSELVDEPGDWPEEGLEIDRFGYGALSASDMDVEARLKWLAKNNRGGADFEPQPYQQLAKVYGEMGHRRDRGRVLMKMETRLRAWQCRKLWGSIRAYGDWKAMLGLPFHILFSLFSRVVVGYGHRPERSLIWAILIIGAVAFWAKAAWDEGSMTPASPHILASTDWMKYGGDDPEASETPGLIWSQKTKEGRDYETFNAAAYAADLFIPLVNFGQEEAWAPSTARGAWGYHLWWAKWIVKGLGWLITAMGAAAITGIIRNE